MSKIVAKKPPKEGPKIAPNRSIPEKILINVPLLVPLATCPRRIDAVVIKMADPAPSINLANNNTK